MHHDSQSFVRHWNLNSVPCVMMGHHWWLNVHSGDSSDGQTFDYLVSLEKWFMNKKFHDQYYLSFRSRRKKIQVCQNNNMVLKLKKIKDSIWLINFINNGPLWKPIRPIVLAALNSFWIFCTNLFFLRLFLPNCFSPSEYSQCHNLHWTLYSIDETNETSSYQIFCGEKPWMDGNRRKTSHHTMHSVLIPFNYI